MVEPFLPDHQLPPILYKYTPQPHFLKNGLFLFSPPGINDPKEALPETIFQHYSPEDYALARAQAEQNGFYNLSDEELKKLFMNPYLAHRRDEKNYPALWRAGVEEPWLRAEPFHTIEEYYHAVAEHALTLCRQSIVRTLGIFSMTESTDETMWAYYAANHTGIRVAFDVRHPFFSQKGSPFPVEYTDTPIYISSYSGRVRIAGHLMSMEMIMRGEIPGVPPQLLIRKRRGWANEREWRMVRYLHEAQEIRQVDGGASLHLFAIPPESITAITIGYKAQPELTAEVTETVRSNATWAHLKLLKREQLPSGVVEERPVG